MALSDTLAVIAIIVAIIGIGVAISYGRRTARQHIRWRNKATPLISSVKIPDEADIAITISGQLVSNPYICEFTIGNPDRQDIDSRAFDQGRSVRFELTECKPVCFIKSKDNTALLRGEGESIFLEAGLLPAKSLRSITFITDGEPKIELAEAHLANVVIGRSAGGWLAKLRKSLGSLTGELIRLIATAIRIISEQATSEVPGISEDGPLKPQHGHRSDSCNGTRTARDLP